MSYPKMDNSVKTAISQLKDIANRHQNDDSEVFSLVQDIEKRLSRIETKANRLAKIATKKSKSQDKNLAVTPQTMNNTIAAF